MLFPRTIFGFFTSDEEVIEACMSMIFVLVLLSYACGLRAPANGFVNGIGNSQLNFVMAIFDAIINQIGFLLLFGLVLDILQNAINKRKESHREWRRKDENHGNQQGR